MSVLTRTLFILASLEKLNGYETKKDLGSIYKGVYFGGNGIFGLFNLIKFGHNKNQELASEDLSVPGEVCLSSTGQNLEASERKKIFETRV